MNDKEFWVMEYIENTYHKSVSMLDENFVNDYIKNFGPSYEVTLIGAFRCKELSKLLSNMYKKDMLKRMAAGLSGGAWQDGFPKWIYVYSLY